MSNPPSSSFLHTNRLALEKSPYLLQHAHNPVDWYPWGEEAFELAKRQEKPIFLSIGYSTCHWCHVMERESFENEAVAAILNEHFISIKVDREERPDVDAFYMQAVQAMSGSGGWPMSVFLANDLQPFFAGTYFPPKQAYGRPSFTGLLERIVELWGSKRAELIESGNGFVQSMRSASEEKEEPGALTEEAFDNCFQFYRRSFDAVDGGFGGAPKFPRPVILNFLFGYAALRTERKASEMALHTLRKMAQGGMHDHLGGGFHRYSVDKFWRVSHFEKMLYDQAQLVESYLDAWVVTREPLFQDAARDIIEYVLRDLRHPEGGFFSAEDADSEGEEGSFYVWTMEDLRGALEEDAELVAFYYGMTVEGNFEHGKNVLHISRSLTETAEKFGAEEDMIADRLSAAREVLFALRETRERPLRDDKILTSWNGLMIGAMARAGLLLDEPRYLNAAQRAAEFLLGKLRPTGTLLHRWCDGEAKYNAYLDDYAFFVKGLLDLYEATFEARWIEAAEALQVEQREHLEDQLNGGYFLSRPSPDPLTRSRGDYDGAEPNGNSISARNLLRLAAITGREDFKQYGEGTVAGFAARVQNHPYAMPEMLLASAPTIFGSIEIVFAGPSKAPEYRSLVEERWQHLIPNSVTMSAATAPAANTKQGDAVMAFLCRNFVCELPVGDPLAFSLQLREVSVE